MKNIKKATLYLDTLGLIFRHTGLTAYKYIEKDLKFKLKKYGGYDVFFKRCESEAKEYPKAFKAKY